MKNVRPHPTLKLFSHAWREHRDKLFGNTFRNAHKPWMRYREIEIVEEILRRLQPKSCLEWGAGYSTLFFPQQLASDARWLSVDHDESWARNIREMGPAEIVTIEHVPANRFPWSDPEEDGSAEDLADYLSYPEQFAPFDFILIDGRARNECIQKARNLVQHDGVVLLHDANREFYQKETGAFEHQILLQGYRENAGGIWLGSPGRPIGQILDLEFHRTVWRLCRSAGALKIKC